MAESDDGTGSVGDSLFRSVIGGSGIDNAVSELVETSIDHFLTNPALDAIPVVASLRALARGASSYRDAWLNKKLVATLYGVGLHDDQDRERWRRRLRDEADTAETGERVIAVIDRVTSTNKAQVIGALFRAYLDGECDRETFLSAVEMVDDALTADLAYLVRAWKDGDEEASTARLVAVGLMEDRTSAILDENSKPPTPSDEGRLLRSVAEADPTDPDPTVPE